MSVLKRTVTLVGAKLFHAHPQQTATTQVHALRNVLTHLAEIIAQSPTVLLAPDIPLVTLPKRALLRIVHVKDA
jgi:hypothetical protein